MEIREFLAARFDDMEAALEWYKDSTSTTQPFPVAMALEELKVNRAILKWHENWPVLVEQRPEFSVSDDFDPKNPDAMVFQMKASYYWTIERDYVKKFGGEPPTTTILGIMAQPYKDHPDFDPKWRI